MARKRETRRQQSIQKKLRAVYGSRIWLFKVHGGPFQRSGVPDLVGVIDGLFFAFEVKEPDGNATLIQLETINDIRKAGGITGLIEAADEAIQAIDRALGRAKGRR